MEFGPRRRTENRLHPPPPSTSVRAPGLRELSQGPLGRLHRRMERVFSGGWEFSLELCSDWKSSGVQKGYFQPLETRKKVLRFFLERAMLDGFAQIVGMEWREGVSSNIILFRDPSRKPLETRTKIGGFLGKSDYFLKRRGIHPWKQIHHQRG